MIPSSRSLKSKLLSESNLSQRNEKKSQIFLGALAVAALGLGLSNPGQAAYVNYASAELSKRTAQQCNQTGRVQGICKFAAARSSERFGTMAAGLIDDSTERTNLVLFSIYSTQDPFPFSDKTTKTLGIARLFIPFARG
ncbi:MAG: DUF4359 domain-containing protein [Cyanobacteria bacterium J06621_11]